MNRSYFIIAPFFILIFIFLTCNLWHIKTIFKQQNKYLCFIKKDNFFFVRDINETIKFKDVLRNLPIVYFSNQKVTALIQGIQKSAHISPGTPHYVYETELRDLNSALSLKHMNGYRLLTTMSSKRN